MKTESVLIDGTRYTVRHAGPAWATYSWSAERLARWCEQDLYLEPTRIAWYVVEPPDPSHRRVLRGYVHSDEPGLIYVRGDQSLKETLISTAHELYHKYEYRLGRATDEAQAEAYGRRVADQYLAGDLVR